MDKTYHAEPSEIPAWMRRLHEYSGKTFRVVVCESMTPSGMQWSGGSRSKYVAVRLLDQEQRPIVDQRPWPANMSLPPAVDIQPGWMVVEHSIFCGKDMGLRFYCRPENAFAALEAPELDWEMRVVLVATRSLKNSYGGRTGIRREEAMQMTGISGSAYDAAYESCISGGYLRKNGSITPAGRNAAGTASLHSLKKEES